MSDRTQEIKNLRAVAVASKNYIDKRINDLQWQLGTYDLSADSDTTSAHIKTLPSGTIQTTVAKVEGVGYKVNQIIPPKPAYSAHEITMNFNSTNGNYVFNGTADANAMIFLQTVSDTTIYLTTGHKYLLASNYNGLTGTNLADTWQAHYNYSRDGSNKFIFTGKSDTQFQLSLTVNSGVELNNYSFYVNLFDLTADFGSGNEPSTVSDCATAYLQRGIIIYEYTPQQSSIKNNAFTGVKVEGFNKWDEVFGVAFNGRYGSANFIEIIPNTIYCIKAPYLYEVFGYDINQSNGSGIVLNQVSSGVYTFTTPSNCHYIKFNLGSGYGTTYQNDICINISGSANGTYVPYIQPTTISVDLTTIKDSNNVSLFPSGKMMGNSSVADFITPTHQESRYIEYTFTGDESYSYQENGHRVIVSLPLTELGVVGTTNGISNTGLNFVTNNYDSNGIYIATSSTYQQIFVGYGGVITDNATAKAFLIGKTIQYERATYLTSNTDLTSLTKINAQSNGTINLNNTDNVDMPNTIKSLKEVAK